MYILFEKYITFSFLFDVYNDRMVVNLWLSVQVILAFYFGNPCFHESPVHLVKAGLTT